MRDRAILPLSFGTILRTREDIVALIKSAYKAFDDGLGQLRDEIESGLKVLWDGTG